METNKLICTSSRIKSHIYIGLNFNNYQNTIQEEAWNFYYFTICNNIGINNTFTTIFVPFYVLRFYNIDNVFEGHQRMYIPYNQIPNKLLSRDDLVTLIRDINSFFTVCTNTIKFKDRLLIVLELLNLILYG